MPIKLDHKTQTVILPKELVIKSPLVYEYFSKLPEGKREEALRKAIYIGTLALIEDRIAAFLAKTKNELGTELEHLKILFELKTQFFTRSAVKGKAAEKELVGVLNDYFEQKGFKDYALPVGDVEGKYKSVKTGDILCFVDGRDELRIVIEVKFTKSLPLGDIAERALKEKTDNIWGQLLESKANREADEAILVFDKSLTPVLAENYGPAKFIPNVGFVVFVDTQKGDYVPLLSIYNVIRSILLSKQTLSVSSDLLHKIFEKVLSEVRKILDIRQDIKKNITHNQKILEKLETSLRDLEISESYLLRLLKGEELDTDDLYKFFIGVK